MSQQLYRIWLLDLEWCHKTTIKEDLPFDVADESFLKELTRWFQKQILLNETFRRYHLSTDQLIPR